MTRNQNYFITPEGHKKLVDELHDNAAQMADITQKIDIARQDGDLKENGAYHAAKDEKRKLMARRDYLNARLEKLHMVSHRDIEVKYIDAHNNFIRVFFDTIVVLRNEQTKLVVQYHIVGEDESDMECRKISVTSPLGHELMGKNFNQVVIFEAPNGSIKTLRILEIKAPLVEELIFAVREHGAF